MFVSNDAQHKVSLAILLHDELGFNYRKKICGLCNIKQLQLSNQRKINSKHRIQRKRLSWKSFINGINDKFFRKMFRIVEECFKQLCDDIIKYVGIKKFCSKDYLKQLEQGHVGSQRQRARYFALKKINGGMISGEAKVAISLRFLAGGSYLDLAPLYGISFSYSLCIFKNVVSN